MTQSTLTVRPHTRKGFVVTEEGEVHRIPKGWACLPPGDAGLTRKLKSLGPSWTVKERRRRREVSLGVWAPADNLTRARELVSAQREDPRYERRKASDARRRDKKQQDYVEEFEQEILRFLDFAPRYDTLAQDLARAVAAHATPVGSGTVARTQRISVERRAEAAVIAWMRHHTTTYDAMHIPRAKGHRREVRRMLAERSRQLLEDYRRGESLDPDRCLLALALAAAEQS